LTSRREGLQAPADTPPDAAADAVVVAAGASSRMGGIDKLAATVHDRPLLAWSLDAIAAAPAVGRIVVVVASHRLKEVAAAAWLPAKVAKVVAGGARRQESVAAGLAALDALDAGAGQKGQEDRIVLVHDGARPLVSPALVGRIVAAAATHGAAIPVLPVAETLKRLDRDLVVGTLERDGLATAQTPQAARRSLLRKALAERPADGPETWTDEAALLEACNIAVHAIPGEPSNLKVTLPDDLGRVEAALRGAGRPRIGFGQDRHPFGPGEPLVLAGVVIPGAPRLLGHSDGDVALHAVADALLGAAGLGDLGRLFPPDERTPRGVASGELLAEVLRRLAAAGLRPLTVDLTIAAGRPRLGDRLDQMRSRLAELLVLPPGSVGVKASTGNLDGTEGAGRGISAQAIAAVEPIP
jgi:2-C-methyl-D-erythritol 4-phosphate cytidylyltransferase/2-C-methyl-D-erythritol 2,4-cyclodiphosphate synthase